MEVVKTGKSRVEGSELALRLPPYHRSKTLKYENISGSQNHEKVCKMPKAQDRKMSMDARSQDVY